MLTYSNTSTCFNARPQAKCYHWNHDFCFPRAQKLWIDLRQHSIASEMLITSWLPLRTSEVFWMAYQLKMYHQSLRMLWRQSRSTPDFGLPLITRFLGFSSVTKSRHLAHPRRMIASAYADTRFQNTCTVRV